MLSTSSWRLQPPCNLPPIYLLLQRSVVSEHPAGTALRLRREVLLRVRAPMPREEVRTGSLLLSHRCPGALRDAACPPSAIRCSDSQSASSPTEQPTVVPRDRRPLP